MTPWSRILERLRTRAASARTWRRPAPQVTVELDRYVPAWALRAASALVALGCAALVASNPVHWWIAAALVTTIVVRPGGPAPALLAAGVGVLLLAAGPASAVRTALLVLGLHLVVQLATLAGDVAWRGQVERQVLIAAAKPFALLQALAQAAGLLGAWLTGRQLTDVQLPILAALALAVLAWALLLRLRSDSTR